MSQGASSVSLIWETGNLGRVPQQDLAAGLSRLLAPLAGDARLAELVVAMHKQADDVRGVVSRVQAACASAGWHGAVQFVDASGMAYVMAKRAAAEAATHDLLLYVDSDLRIEGDLRTLLDEVDEDSTTVVGAPTLADQLDSFWGRAFGTWWLFDLAPPDPDRLQQVRWRSNCLVIRRRTMLQMPTDGLDEGWRSGVSSFRQHLARAGVTSRIAPRVVAHHPPPPPEEFFDLVRNYGLDWAIGSWRLGHHRPRALVSVLIGALRDLRAVMVATVRARRRRVLPWHEVVPVLLLGLAFHWLGRAWQAVHVVQGPHRHRHPALPAGSVGTRAATGSVAVDGQDRSKAPPNRSGPSSSVSGGRDRF